MRHNVFGRKLNRDTKSRQILFKNLITALIEKERIETTEARAKAIKGLMDKLVTKAKTKTRQSQKFIQAFLGNKDAVEKLVNSIAPKLGNRTSGFMRIMKLKTRKGDNASMVQLEFVGGKESEPLPKEKTPNIKETRNIKQNSKGTRIKRGNKSDKGK